jgi:hypothetical protein
MTSTSGQGAPWRRNLRRNWRLVVIAVALIVLAALAALWQTS